MWVPDVRTRRVLACMLQNGAQNAAPIIDHYIPEENKKGYSDCSCEPHFGHHPFIDAFGSTPIGKVTD